MNVDALLADMTHEQFNEWIAIYRLEPWGDDWTQAGTIAAEVANAGGKYVDHLSAADFVPTGQLKQVGLSDQQMKAKYERMYGAK